MKHSLNPVVERDLLDRGFSRRSFGRIAAVLTAGASLPFYNEGALAQLSSRRELLPADAVKIDANENPLGPCQEALEAIYSVSKRGGRYLYEETDLFAQTVAEVEGVPRDHVTPFAGSSDPLHRAVLAFSSPSRGVVVGDPGYEAPFRAAEFMGARVSRVPLTKDYAHDVKAMVTADPTAGLLYICSPNNPTGTLTSRANIEYALAHKPQGAIILLDEAYIHLCDAAPSTDLAAAGKDIIILRTFSKIYGMAGLRAGFAMGRPDLLSKLRHYGAGALPVTAMVAANTSLKVKNLVPERKKIIRSIREDVFSFLDRRKFSFVPSVSNKFMLDTKRPAGEFIQAMAAHKIFVGRQWPIWPTHSRITIGTREEMEKFKTALLKVMA